jgi:hypothetical protein
MLSSAHGTIKEVSINSKMSTCLCQGRNRGRLDSVFDSEVFLLLP